MTIKTNHRFSLPHVPISFILLLLGLAAIYWFFSSGKGNVVLPKKTLNGDTLKIIRIPGGTLSTGGLTKTEILSKSDKSNRWLGTTSSVIRIEATYRYDVALRPSWNIGFDETRKVAFVIAPRLQPQIPVATNSKTMQQETSSGWARFDKWEHLEELRKELSPFLEKKAKSQDYIDLAREEARRAVEEFVSDWIIKERGWKDSDRPVVKVYFDDEKDIPVPTGRNLREFLP